MTQKTLLRGLSAAAIVGAVDHAAQRWSDADFPPRVRTTQAIVERLGYSTPVVEYALDRLFCTLRADTLTAAIEGDLGTLEALDDFVERPGRPASFARGVDAVTIIASDTSIGVALVPAIYALCAKSAVLVKDRSDELVGAFFASLIDERPEFSDAAVARTWTGGASPDETTALGRADVVVAFGGAAALSAIRGHMRPDARFVPFGHRASVGYLDVASSGNVIGSARLDGIAADALLYDGTGCLSLHALFVRGERATIHNLCADLAQAFERATIEFPTGRGDPQRSAMVAAYRNLGHFRAANGKGNIFASERAQAMIAFDPPRIDPPPFLPRVLPVFPVVDDTDAADYLRGHRIAVEALGVLDTQAPHARSLAEACGAVRIARLGEMQAPPPSGHHGGASRIADFVRWIDRE